LIAANDPHSFRPFAIGRLGSSYVFASETCAFEAIGATYWREMQPGEMIVLEHGHSLREFRYTQPKHKTICAMEYVYFARPDSNIQGVNIHAARKRMGKKLAIESFVD